MTTDERRPGPDARDERDHLIHELEVHQTELEAQNQQLREAQHLLEESRARYADLYDFAPVGYCTFDSAGCVSEINLTGAAMLGTQRGRVIGKPFAVYLSEPDRAAFRNHLHHRLMSPRGPASVEVTLAGPSGQPIVIRLLSAVAFDHTGAVVGLRSVFTDITEQRRAEEALRLAVHTREDFLAIVSHDLRTPLNTILLGLELLQTSRTLDATSVGHVERVCQAATRMTRMLSDLLDLSSMDAGHLSMDRKLESVDALLAAVVQSASSVAAATIRPRSSPSAISGRPSIGSIAKDGLTRAARREGQGRRPSRGRSRDRRPGRRRARAGRRRCRGRGRATGFRRLRRPPRPLRPGPGAGSGCRVRRRER